MRPYYLESLDGSVFVAAVVPAFRDDLAAWIATDGPEPVALLGQNLAAVLEVVRDVLREQAPTVLDGGAA